MVNCQNYKGNLKKCSCTYEPCPRKGICCECIAYHRKNSELPACFFNREAELTYDRSVGNFISMMEKTG